jgi:hypothetical protein
MEYFIALLQQQVSPSEHDKFREWVMKVGFPFPLATEITQNFELLVYHASEALKLNDFESFKLLVFLLADNHPSQLLAKISDTQFRTQHSFWCAVGYEQLFAAHTKSINNDPMKRHNFREEYDGAILSHWIKSATQCYIELGIGQKVESLVKTLVRVYRNEAEKIGMGAHEHPLLRVAILQQLFISSNKALVCEDANKADFQSNAPLYSALLSRQLAAPCRDSIESHELEAARLNSHFTNATTCASANDDGMLEKSIEQCLQRTSSDYLSRIQAQMHYADKANKFYSVFTRYCANLLLYRRQDFNRFFSGKNAAYLARIMYHVNAALLEDSIKNPDIQRDATLFCARAFNLLAENKSALYYRTAAILYARIQDLSALTACARLFLEFNRTAVVEDLEDKEFVLANPVYAEQMQNFLSRSNSQTCYSEQRKGHSASMMQQNNHNIMNYGIFKKERPSASAASTAAMTRGARF